MDALTIIKMKILAQILVILATVFPLIFTQSCKKVELDPEYPFIITVKTLSDSTRVANVFVEVLALVPKSIIDFNSYTDENGEVDFVYDEEATFLIRATRGNKMAYTWIGCNYIRLRAEKKVRQTVYIRPYNPKVEGC